MALKREEFPCDARGYYVKSHTPVLMGAVIASIIPSAPEVRMTVKAGVLGVVCSHINTRLHALRLAPSVASRLLSPSLSFLLLPFLPPSSRVPRKCVWVPSRSHMHARLYTNIDTPSERDCPFPLLSMQWGHGRPRRPW